MPKRLPLYAYLQAMPLTHYRTPCRTAIGICQARLEPIENADTIPPHIPTPFTRPGNPIKNIGH